MLIGQSELVIDKTGQLTLPPKYCEAIKEGAFLTMGFDRNLLLLPSEEFQNMLRYISSLSITDPLARSLLRFLLGNAIELSMDNENQISIPKNLLEFAGIEQDIIAIGQGEYSELWAPRFWKKQVQILQHPDANNDRFASLFIAVA
jgi:MraZ protein